MTAIYRFTNSHVAVATLQADANAVVANWTTANPVEQWNVEERSNPIPYSVKRRAMGGRLGVQGYTQLNDWVLLLSFDQWDWYLDNKMTNRLDTLATIQTRYASRDGWACFTCIAEMVYENVQTVNNTWAVQTTIKFTRATLIT